MKHLHIFNNSHFTYKIKKKKNLYQLRRLEKIIHRMKYIIEGKSLYL
jgi:hypothetical protein